LAIPRRDVKKDGQLLHRYACLSKDLCDCFKHLVIVICLLSVFLSFTLSDIKSKCRDGTFRFFFLIISGTTVSVPFNITLLFPDDGIQLFDLDSDFDAFLCTSCFRLFKGVFALIAGWFAIKAIKAKPTNTYLLKLY
uniref:EXS domain-containing protein n=1 Tax=Brugia timori TaxID=42155 RepID=A0A0R3Q8L3_9BILA